eukprot:756465-Hanusia_phi.AAC.2
MGGAVIKKSDPATSVKPEILGLMLSAAQTAAPARSDFCFISLRTPAQRTSARATTGRREGARRRKSKCRGIQGRRRKGRGRGRGGEVLESLRKGIRYGSECAAMSEEILPVLLIPSRSLLE